MLQGLCKTLYLERVELYFQANDIEEAKQVPILLSSIGAKMYELLRSLTVLKAPKEKSLKDLKTILKSHFEPAPIVIAERYRFHRRQQAEGESIAEYMAELRRLTTHCKFENTVDYLEESLRDRFVCGLRTESTRKRLLTEKNLTFTTALEIAQSLETALKDAQQLKGEASGASCTQCDVTKASEMKEACVTVVARQTTKRVSADLKRPLATTVARRGTLRLFVGAKTNHNVDSFKDTGRRPSGLILMIVERTQETLM